VRLRRWGRQWTHCRCLGSRSREFKSRRPDGSKCLVRQLFTIVFALTTFLTPVAPGATPQPRWAVGHDLFGIGWPAHHVGLRSGHGGSTRQCRRDRQRPGAEAAGGITNLRNVLAATGSTPTDQLSGLPPRTGWAADPEPPCAAVRREPAQPAGQSDAALREVESENAADAEPLAETERHRFILSAAATL
jgi:hypothetical protein